MLNPIKEYGQSFNQKNENHWGINKPQALLLSIKL